MGTTVSKPILHTVESTLLGVAAFVDTIVRFVDHFISRAIATCLSPALAANLFVSPPVPTEHVADEKGTGVTRVCTNDGICYVPATRVQQHRRWRRQKQDDQLKRRKMRAEWAAAGLNPTVMEKQEEEKKVNRQKNINSSHETFTQNNADEVESQCAISVHRTSQCEKGRPTTPFRRKRASTNPVPQLPISLTSGPHRNRPLTAVREASHDQATTSQNPLQATEPPQNPSTHRRITSLPVLCQAKIKAPIAQASTVKIEASAGRYSNDLSAEAKDEPRSAAISPPLLQPRPRRAKAVPFDTTIGQNSTCYPLPSPRLRGTPTPPPVWSRSGTRSRGNSFDIGARTSSPASVDAHSFNDETSSVTSKRSLRNGLLRTGSSTPPPNVAQMADLACKSRWEANARERKVWKGEVKRLTLHRLNEQHTATRHATLHQEK